jgi:hypothetical protein
MTFADLVAGDTIFQDANTLVYHFTSDPQYGTACSQLLQGIENQGWSCWGGFRTRGWSGRRWRGGIDGRWMSLFAFLMSIGLCRQSKRKSDL